MYISNTHKTSVKHNNYLYVGYRMFFHDRARGEAECEIMKKHSIT